MGEGERRCSDAATLPRLERESLLKPPDATNPMAERENRCSGGGKRVTAKAACPGWLCTAAEWTDQLVEALI